MKLSLKEKLAYGLGAVGKDMVYMLSASYVLYYFQDILGVSAIAMGVILMAARVFDAFNDPIMGIIVATLGRDLHNDGHPLLVDDPGVYRKRQGERKPFGFREIHGGRRFSHHNSSDHDRRPRHRRG